MLIRSKTIISIFIQGRQPPHLILAKTPTLTNNTKFPKNILLGSSRLARVLPRPSVYVNCEKRSQTVQGKHEAKRNINPSRRRVK